MKKLVFGLAAAVAVGAFAIESANIVGYGQNSLRFGYCLMTPQFVGVGGNQIALDALTASGTDASDNVVLSTVDEYGTAVDSYSWNDWALSSACWINDSYEKIEGVTVVPGMAFWTSGSDASQVIQSAGEVGTSDVVVNLRFGYTLVGNPFPVDVALQDIVAGGDEASDNVTMSTIDEYGTAIDTYSWNDWALDSACWINDSYEKIEGVSIAPGVGLWTSGSNSSQYIRIPAPEL